MLTASATLISGRSNFGADVVIGLLGVVGYVMVVVGVTLLTTVPRFLAVAVADKDIGREHHVDPSAATMLTMKRWVRWHLTGRWKWFNRQRAAAAGFVEQWGSVFDIYGPRRQWFCAVEALANGTTAVLAGLVVLDNGDGVLCGRLQVLSVIAAVAFLGAVVLLRPMRAVVTRCLATSNAAVTALSAVSGAAGIDTTLLTTLQVFLNGVAVIVVVAGMVMLGNFNEPLRLMISLGRSAPSTRKEELAVAELGPPLTVQARALEEIVRIICERSPRIICSKATGSVSLPVQRFDPIDRVALPQ